MDAIETITDEATGVTASLYIDEFPESPREMGEMASILTQLSDRYGQPDSTHDARIITAWERATGYDDARGRYTHNSNLVERYARVFLDAAAVGWLESGRDSSLVFGYITNARVAELGIPDADAALKGEFDEYRAYCEGDVYVYLVESATGKTLDSCGGFYGYEYAESEARDALSAAVADIHAERASMLRGMVNGKAGA